MFRLASLVLMVLWGVSFASPVHAQSKTSCAKYWGVSFSATPRWQASKQLLLGKLLDVDEMRMSGSEFSGGVVRRCEAGSEWGVDFVVKTFASDSAITILDSTWTVNGVDYLNTDHYTLPNVKIVGVAPHKMWAVTVGRTDIGFKVSGVVGKYLGDVIKRSVRFREFRVVRTETITTKPMADMIKDLGGLGFFGDIMGDLDIGIRVAPKTLLRVNGGVGLVNSRVSVGVTRLIGAEGRIREN